MASSLPNVSDCCAPCCNVTTSIVDITGGLLRAPESLAELRALTNHVDNAVLPVRGHTTEYDGGGGVWIYDAGSVLADDDATVVMPNDVLVANAGRWRRL